MAFLAYRNPNHSSFCLFLPWSIFLVVRICSHPTHAQPQPPSKLCLFASSPLGEQPHLGGSRAQLPPHPETQRSSDPKPTHGLSWVPVNSSRNTLSNNSFSVSFHFLVKMRFLNNKYLFQNMFLHLEFKKKKEEKRHFPGSLPWPISPSWYASGMGLY